MPMMILALVQDVGQNDGLLELDEAVLVSVAPVGCLFPLLSAVRLAARNRSRASDAPRARRSRGRGGWPK
eukprot:9483818-Pyramimonas_sp.AAC.1